MKRRDLAKLYNQALSSIQWLRLPTHPENVEHVWHQYTVVVDFDGTSAQAIGSPALIRDAVIEKLAKNGIGAMCYYPVPAHLQKAFAQFGYNKGDLPVSEKVADRVISLPMYPELEEKSIEKIAAALKQIGDELCTMPSHTANVSVSV